MKLHHDYWEYQYAYLVNKYFGSNMTCAKHSSIQLFNWKYNLDLLQYGIIGLDFAIRSSPYSRLHIPMSSMVQLVTPIALGVAFGKETLYPYF
jgi:hypothetical protein